MSANFHDLIHGFHSFKESYFMKEREFFDALAHGQSPKTLVIACCDSRADPALLMGCKPGDLFVIRSVAAIVPSKDEAAHADAREYMETQVRANTLESKLYLREVDAVFSAEAQRKTHTAKKGGVR